PRRRRRLRTRGASPEDRRASAGTAWSPPARRAAAPGPGSAAPAGQPCARGGASSRRPAPRTRLPVLAHATRRVARTSCLPGLMGPSQPGQSRLAQARVRRRGCAVSTTGLLRALPGAVTDRPHRRGVRTARVRQQPLRPGRLRALPDRRDALPPGDGGRPLARPRRAAMGDARRDRRLGLVRRLRRPVVVTVVWGVALLAGFSPPSGSPSV